MTKTFFKSTDKNGYIPTDSGHHPNWLKAILQGQFQRIRRNCSRLQDFESQVNVLKKCFLEKGYKPLQLDKEMREVALLDRQDLLVSKMKNIDSNKKDLEWSFVTTFSSHFWWVNRTIQKYWQILKSDNILGLQLPERPKVLFCKNQTLKDLVAPSVVDPPPRVSMLGNLKGFFPCRKCSACASSKTIRTSTFSSYVTSRTYSITEFITCGTIGVFYLRRCPCGFQYIGRTTRALEIRIGEHLSNIRRGFIGHSVLWHFHQFHNLDPSLLEVIVIEKFVPHWRGNDLKRHISR